MGRAVFQYSDADSDRPQFSIPGPDAAADGSDYDTIQGQFSALLTALGGVVIGTPWFNELASQTTTAQTAPPTNQFAQANTRWVLEFSVDGFVGGPYRITVPTANLSLGIVRNGRIELDLAAGPGLALKTAFEAFFLDEQAVEAGGTGRAILQVVYHAE
ncbi:MAG: hypothetical protein AAFU54_22015 [Chloroflexota bacterium]